LATLSTRKICDLIGRAGGECIRTLCVCIVLVEINLGCGDADATLLAANLTPAERAIHVDRRKEVYEDEHPDTKKGSAGGRAKAGKSAKSQNATTQPAFIDDTAEKTGKHRATVAREARRGKKGAAILPDNQQQTQSHRETESPQWRI